MTIKHAAITNLDMPAMTMVFKAGEPEQLKNIQAGEKIEFRAENVAGAFVLTEIKAVKQLRKLLLAPAAEGADFLVRGLPARMGWRGPRCFAAGG